MLQIITDNYILSKEAIKKNFHNSSEFRKRLQVNFTNFFAEYVARALINKNLLTKKDLYNIPAINNFLKACEDKENTRGDSNRYHP